MKLLKRKDTNIAIVIGKSVSEEENGALRVDDVIYCDCNIQNCDIVDTLVYPDKFVGRCYTHDTVTDSYECINPQQVEMVYPVATISMRQARLGLLAKGLLDDVESHVATLSRAAQIEWEFSVEVKRNYPLVLELQQLLSLADDEIDLFFDEAKLI